MSEEAILRYHLRGHHHFRISGNHRLSRNLQRVRFRHGLFSLLHIWSHLRSQLHERILRYLLQMYDVHRYRSVPSEMLHSNICHAYTGSGLRYLHIRLPANPSLPRTYGSLHHNQGIQKWSVCKPVLPDLLTCSRHHRWSRKEGILQGLLLLRKTAFLYLSVLQIRSSR